MVSMNNFLARRFLNISNSVRWKAKDVRPLRCAAHCCAIGARSALSSAKACAVAARPAKLAGNLATEIAGRIY